MSEATIAVGDVVGFIFGQPGNDMTYLLVEAISEDGSKVSGFDLTFQMSLEDIHSTSLWKASERELDSEFGIDDGTYTIRQLAEMRRRRERPSGGRPAGRAAVPLSDTQDLTFLLKRRKP